MAAQDVKEKVLDALDDGRQLARRLLADFKDQTIYFKARVGVVGGYVLLVLLSLIIIPPASEKNPLGARVKVDSISFGSKQKTYIEISNEGTAMWENATITINGTVIPEQGKNAGKVVGGTWVLQDRWRRGERRQLFPEKFRDKAGLPPEVDVKVSEVVIDAEGEHYVKVVGKKSGP